MPKETENYKFKKPLYSDNADVAVLNENFDEIDKAFTPSLSASDEPGVQNKGKLEIVLGWIVNRIKAITGLSTWQGTPEVTLADCANHISNGTHQNATTSSNGFMSYVDKTILYKNKRKAVQKLIQQRGIDKGNLKETDKYQNRYTLSGKIICSECGHSFKRRIHKKNANENYVAWCCKKHIENNMACSMKYIKDEDLKYAFVLMMNKLIFSHKTVLKPFIRSLGGMDCDNVKDEISRIDCRCVEISKKMQVISKLAADGLLDGSAFNNEKNELNIEYQKLVERKKHLYDYTNEFKENIEYATTLYKFCSKSEMLNEYSDELFEKHISRVIVYSRDSVGFELKCGIVFTERLG